MKADRIRALKLRDLKVSSMVRNKAVDFIQQKKDPDWDPGWSHARISVNGKLAESLTVADFISVCDGAPLGRFGELPVQGWSSVIEALAELGFTHFNWWQMPTTTVTTEMLKKMKKALLCDQSVLVLNTLSGIAVRALADYLNKEVRAVTIADLLDVRVADWERRWLGLDISQSVENAREKLKAIGFTWKDGVFLREGTRRDLIGSLTSSHNLSNKMAGIIADVAVARGWVKPFRA